MYYVIGYVLGILLTSFGLGMYETFNKKNIQIFSNPDEGSVIIFIFSCILWPATIVISWGIFLVVVFAVWIPKKLHKAYTMYRDRALIRSVKKYQAKQG